MPTTTGMKGGGYYDAHSREQRAALDVFLPWLEEAAAGLPEPSGWPTSYNILDIGSSEGGNALYATRRLIERLRRSSELPVWAFFCDLPTNDYNQLFANLFPKGVPALPGPQVFSSVIAGTAFGRLVPPCTLHVATTFNAIGFLDKKPDAELPRYILPMGPGSLAPREGVSVSEDERAPFRLQAAADLRRFYAARAEELVGGGKVLVQTFGRNQDVSTSYGIYDVLSDAVLDAIENGTLGREVYEALVFPIYFRSLEELLEPLESDGRLTQAFTVEKAESREVPAPFNVALGETGDVAAWARGYTGFLRAFTEAILASALPDGPSRAEILDWIYRRVEQRLGADPGRYEFRYISVAALLTRR